MATGRMLRKRLSKSKKFAALKTDAARCLYCMIYPHTDVEGRVEAEPVILRGEVLPYLNWDNEKIEMCLHDLHQVGLIILYEIDGNSYAQFIRFEDFQTLDKKKEAKSQIPPPPKTKRRCLTLDEYSFVWEQWEKGKEICPVCGKQAKFIAGKGVVVDGYIPLQIDHIISLAKGGQTCKENLRVVCQKCNASKGCDLTLELLESSTGVTPSLSKVNVKVKRSKEKLSKTPQELSHQITNLTQSFSQTIQEDIEKYLEIITNFNKRKKITLRRKQTLLLELYNSKERCNDDELFTYALQETIKHRAGSIGYVNAIIRRKKVETDK